MAGRNGSCPAGRAQAPFDGNRLFNEMATS